MWQFLLSIKNEVVIDAHGYVFTYPGSFYALTGMEWVWGICIDVGICDTHSMD